MTIRNFNIFIISKLQSVMYYEPCGKFQVTQFDDNMKLTAEALLVKLSAN